MAIPFALEGFRWRIIYWASRIAELAGKAKWPDDGSRRHEDVPDIDGWWDNLVHDRAAAVLELVIHAVADDYESVETILQSVNEWNLEPDFESWPAMRAVPISRSEVINAMRELTREGYVQANILDASKPYARAVEFRQDDAERLWFLVTSKGTAAVQRIDERIFRNS